MCLPQSKAKLFGKEVTLYRVNNDVYGNPRYVIHYMDIECHIDEIKEHEFTWRESKYQWVLFDMKGSGFKKFHNKQFGGGLVFQSYNVQEDMEHLERHITKVNEKYAKRKAKEELPSISVSDFVEKELNF